MKRKVLVMLVLLLIGGVGGRARSEDPVKAETAFARLKTLEGTWAAAGEPGKQATSKFELTANGTVLVEHYSNPALPGGGHMMTAYHLDGRDLVLTHYCIAANQPTLRLASWDEKTGQLQFEFVRAANLRSPGAGHMRRARYRFEGPDRFTTEWEFFENGTLKMTETETFSRVR